jgi:signal transduction histidine kinase
MSFGVSQNEMGVTVESMQGGSLNTSAIFSTEPAFIHQFAAIFEELWSKGVEAEGRIKEIESDVTTFIDIIQNPLEIQKQYRSLASSARQQILLFLPSTTAYSREEKIGIFEALREAAKRGVEIKILLPVLDKIDAQIQEKIDALKGFQIRKMRTTAQTQARSKILLVDKKEYLMVEIKDDSKETFSEAVGSAIYSNSRSTVLSYITMFESLWAQSELYEKLDAHDRMQREFINIAAHELRTPTQSILGYSELLEKEVESEESKEMLKGLSKNASRLQGLINDVLDVARIEGGAMHLQRSEADIEEIIRAALSDAESQAKAIGSRAELTYEPAVNKDTTLPTEINLDKERILQVLANLLSNALKFTKEGKIEVDAERHGQSIVIKVKDSGTGIDPEIFPKLFEKFASKSEKGTGLGLFISKNIIEAHGGRIWAENNTDGKGATIAFSLPLKRSPSS